MEEKKSPEVEVFLEHKAVSLLCSTERVGAATVLGVTLDQRVNLEFPSGLETALKCFCLLKRPR